MAGNWISILGILALACQFELLEASGDCTAEHKNWTCCKSGTCGLGEGDCDRDSECWPGLVCGKDNCVGFNPKWNDKDFDCCTMPLEEKNCTADKNDSYCCDIDPKNASERCGLGGGDCDKDAECQPGLVCGSNNCVEFNAKWKNKEFDCCTFPASALEKKCTADKNDYNCCSTSNRCGLGGGDCDGDNECETGLVCSVNNCVGFSNKWQDKEFDCCTFPADRLEEKKCTSAQNGSGCCSSSNMCGLGGGDCDGDSECMPGLVCGKNNCVAFDPKWNKNFDCCTFK